MISTQQDSFSIYAKNPKDAFANTIRQADIKTIEAALLAIDSQEFETLFKTLPNRNVEIVEDLRVAALLKPIFIQDPTFLKEIQNSGFETAKDFAIHELSQELWDRTACVVDSSGWVQVLLLTPTQKESVAIENPIQSLNTIIQNRLEEIKSVEKAIELGWLHTDREGATEQQKTLWEQEREDWPLKVALWKANSLKLINKMENNESHHLFAEDQKDRKKQYADFAEALTRALPILAENNTDYDVYDVGVPYILENCRTAWEEFTGQLGKRTGITLKSSDSFFVKVAQTLRNLREEILVTHVLPAAIRACNPRESEENIAMWTSNVHYKKSIKQWANAPYHLAMSLEKLGTNDPMLRVLSPYFSAVADKIMTKHYTTDVIEDRINTLYKGLSEKEKESLETELLSPYQTDLIEGKAPYLDQLDSLRVLYACLEQTDRIEIYEEYTNELKKLYNQWLDKGFTPPFSAMSPKELLNRDLNRSPFASSLHLGKSLQTILERMDISSEQKTDLKALITRLEQIDSPETKSSYLLAQKKRIKEIASELESQIAIKNKEQLKEKIFARTGQLTQYGTLLLGAKSKTLSPLEKEESTLPQKLLNWAKKSVPEHLLEALVLHLSKIPADYLSLPEEIKNTYPLQILLESNPGLKYGLSLDVYNFYFNHPNKVAMLIQKDPIALKIFKDDKEIMLEAVSKYGWILEFASENLRNDKELVLAAVTQNGEALRLASKALQNDKEVVLAAVTQNGEALRLASKALQNDKEVVLAAVTQNGKALEFASKALQNDKEVVLVAVTQNGKALEFASKILQNDKEVVLAAVTQNGEALELASKALQNDKEVVLAIVTQNGEALEFASKILQNDKEIVLAAVTQNGYALEFASAALQNDKEIVLAAVTQNGEALEFASKALQNDKEIVLAAVTQNGEALRLASKALQNDKEVVLAAVTQNYRALVLVYSYLRNDPEVRAAAGLH